MSSNLSRPGMNTLAGDATVADVRFSPDTITVSLSDGRTIATPIKWYPRLNKAKPDERAHWEICGADSGIHWPKLDEDLSIEGMLRGIPSAEWKAPLNGS